MKNKMQKVVAMAVLLLAFAIGLMVAPTQAAMEKPWFLAVQSGYQDISDSGFDARTVYGFKIGRRIHSKFDLGVNVLYSQDSVDVPLNSSNRAFDFSDLAILAALNYRLDHVLEGWRVGVLAGVDIRSFELWDINFNKKGVDDTVGAFGVETGYDKNFANGVFVGAAVNYLSVGKAEKSLTSGTPPVTRTVIGILESTNLLNILVSAGIRF